MNATAYCDRCPARARVRAEMPAGELHFCNHHIREHRDRLREAGAQLITLPGRPAPPRLLQADRS
jgi:hypothetical protein